MVEENKSQEINMKNIDETRNYFIDKINQNKLMSKKHVFNYSEHQLILVSTVTECVSIFAFAYLGGIYVNIVSSAVGIQICAITAKNP